MTRGEGGTTERLPATLVQIHYHCRPGGVTRVMEEYARAFERIRGSAGATNLIVSHAASRQDGADVTAEYIDVPAFDYRRFRSARAFELHRDHLLRTLERILFTRQLPGPVCLLGHNLSLGKNPALSAAFAEMARRHGQARGLRCVSVIHDLAEEGRSALLRGLRALTAAGVPIERDLYPEQVRLAVVSRSIRQVLGRAGLPAMLLPDPVSSRGSRRLSSSSRAAVTEAVTELARGDGTSFDPRRPTLFYPVRVVSRKNVLEAVLVAVLGYRANLLMGAPGTAPADRALYAELAGFCRRHGLPVVMDVARIAPRLPRAHRGRPDHPFALLYRFADLAVSTSVAEGFGYGLYEPWALGKPVVGRKPVGFLPCGGLRMSHLYDSFPVPAAWVNLKRLSAKYHGHLYQCLGRGRAQPPLARFDRELHARFVRNEEIDFGVLDYGQQWRIVRRIVSSGGELPASAVERIRCQERLFAPRSKEGEGLLIHNRHRIESNLGPAAFDRRLRRCLVEPRRRNTLDPDFGMVLRKLCCLSRSRLLLTPGF